MFRCKTYWLQWMTDSQCVEGWFLSYHICNPILQFSLCKTVVQGNVAKWYLHIPHAVTFFYNIWQRLLCLWHVLLTVIMHWWSVHVNRVSPSKTLKNEKLRSLTVMVQWYPTVLQLNTGPLIHGTHCLLLFGLDVCV